MAEPSADKRDSENLPSCSQSDRQISDGTPSQKSLRPKGKADYLARNVKRCNDEANNWFAMQHQRWIDAIDYDGHEAAPDDTGRDYVGRHVRAAREASTANGSLATRMELLRVLTRTSATRIAWHFVKLKGASTYEQRLRTLGELPHPDPTSKGK